MRKEVSVCICVLLVSSILAIPVSSYRGGLGLQEELLVCMYGVQGSNEYVTTIMR